MVLRIDITDRVTPLVEKRMGGKVSDGLKRVMGVGVVNEVQRHFEGLPPNRNFPGRSTRFWADASRSTSANTTPAGIEIVISKLGVRQRYYGGEIHAVRAKYLTIPAREEAYGRLASEFNNLRFMKFAGGSAALVESDASKIEIGRVGKKDGRRKVKKVGETGGGVMYWLVKSVTQRAAPEILPGEHEIRAAALVAGREYLGEV